MSKNFIIRLSFSFLFFSLLIISPVWATEKINAGFVSGLWYSKKPFFAGDSVRIYSAIQNQSEYDLIGTIDFIDNEQIIGQKDFSAISGRLVEEWLDWQVTSGTHKIYVRISAAKKNVIGQNPEIIELNNNQSKVDDLFVDLDTDQDSIGNQKDEDDDNDGLSDTKETELGTDPLKSDTDGDNLADGQEIQLGSDPLKSDNSLFEIEKNSLKKSQAKISASNTSSLETVGEGSKNVWYGIAGGLKNVYKKTADLGTNLASNLKRVRDDKVSDYGQEVNVLTWQENRIGFFVLTLINAFIYILDHKILFFLLIIFFFYILFKLARFISKKI